MIVRPPYEYLVQEAEVVPQRLRGVLQCQGVLLDSGEHDLLVRAERPILLCLPTLNPKP